MTTGASDLGTALSDLKLAEAMRVLGLLEPGRLQAQAVEWAAAGVDSASVRELAALPPGSDTAERVALLAEAAAELELGFATVQDARVFHVKAVLANPAAGIPGGNPLDISNNFTDHFTSTAKGAFASFTGRFRRRNG